MLNACYHKNGDSGVFKSCSLEVAKILQTETSTFLNLRVKSRHLHYSICFFVFCGI